MHKCKMRVTQTGLGEPSALKLAFLTPHMSWRPLPVSTLEISFCISCTVSHCINGNLDFSTFIFKSALF